MIDELAKILEAFPGASNRTRCFAHILNLVARCILKQFDLPKAQWDDDETMRAMTELAANIDQEEAEMDDGEGEDDSEDGMIDITAEMSEEEIEELEQTAQPVRLVLVKVSGQVVHLWLIDRYLIKHYIITQLRKIAYAIKHSTTIILPEWHAILAKLAKESTEAAEEPLGDRMVPRDVTTRWNSTYDMLAFAYQYRAALDIITANREMKLRMYELSDTDWNIVKDLRDLLKVSGISPLSILVLTEFVLGFQRRDIILLSRHSQSCQSHTCNGSNRSKSSYRSNG